MKLRKWVVNTLIVVQFILMMLLSYECESILLFYLGKIVILAVMVGITYILSKYSNFFD